MVIVRLAGGLGNQMFQYALGRMLSIKNHTKLGLDTSFLLDRTSIPNFTFREYNLEPFNIQAKVLSPKEVPFLYRYHFSGILMRYGDYFRRKILNTPGKEKKEYYFDSNILNLGPNTYLEGWWQNPKYFSVIADVLQKDFTLKAPSEKNKKLVAEIGSKNSVCMHIRRGDYVGHSFHTLLDNQYYVNALKKIAARQSIDCIYVFDRDDIEWCKEHLTFDYPVVFVENDISMAECLNVMKSCNHFILANSSLSWWAGWLGSNKEKIVVAPKKWIEKGDVKDFIPEEWVRI